MNKLMEVLERYFIPVAAKIGSQRHLIAVRDGFVAIMPLIIAGSFAVLLNNIDMLGYQAFMLKTFGEGWKTINGLLWTGSFAVMSLLVVFTTSYSLAKSYDKDGIGCATTCFAALIMLYEGSTADWAIPFGYLGTQGLFVSLILALLLGTLYCKLLGNPMLTIKMPDGVPPAVARSFASLAPSIIILVIAGVFKVVLLWVMKTPDLHAFIFDAIQKPAQDFMSASLGPILALIFAQQLLWFFGLHGSNIIGPVVNAVLLPLLAANTDAYKAGEKIPYMINSQFLDSYVNMGGSGTTIALLIAIYLFSKNKANKAIANLGIAPGLFNINEPVLFGMPIVLNPMYLIPFIFVPLILATVAYLATVSGLVPPVVLQAGWTTPPIIGAVLSTGGKWQAGVLAAVNILIAIALYTPFVMMADRKAALEEAEGLNQ